MSKNNISRPLHLTLKLMSGEDVIPEQWAIENDVSIRSVQRDISNIREALGTVHYPAELVADQK